MSLKKDCLNTELSPSVEVGHFPKFNLFHQIPQERIPKHLHCNAHPCGVHIFRFASTGK